MYHHLVLKRVTHLMFALACIFNKSVILLLSHYYFHWAFAVSERKIYTGVLTHFILVCFLSKGVFCGVFLEWILFQEVVFRVVLYNPEIGKEPPEVFESVNKLHAYDQISTISHFTRSYCQLL